MLTAGWTIAPTPETVCGDRKCDIDIVDRYGAECTMSRKG